MSLDVFISYAHATAHAHARAARDAFEAAGLRTFFDERVIPPGSPFPREIADALLAARVVLVFADETYFERPWCVYEFDVAIAPYRAGAHGGAAPPPDALEHVLVALPAGPGGADKLGAHLPPPLSRGSWLRADQTDALVELVAGRLAAIERTVGERLEGLDDYAVNNLRRGGAVPNVSGLGAAPAHLKGLPDSLKERFVGRTEELWRVFHVLETKRAEGGARACVLQGGGGAGKSQLAAEYVWRYGAKYYAGGLVWVNADCDEPSLLAQFAEVLGSFGAEPPAPATSADDLKRWRAELEAALGRVMREAAGAGAVLWVLDNVPEPTRSAPQQSLKHFCPPRHLVSVLCTTRSTGIKDADAVVPLEELPVALAVELLTQPEVERNWLPDEGWEEIARWVGCLPLALRVLQTSLGDAFVGAQELLAKARAEEPAAALDAGVEALRDLVPPGYLRGVAEAFRFSHESLADTPGAREAAQAFARTSAVPMPEELLKVLVSAPVMVVLARRGWIQSAEGRGGKDDSARYWRMHRVASSYLRGASAEAGADFVAVFDWLERFYSSDPPEALASACQPHLRVACRRFAEWLGRNPQETDSPAARRGREFGVRRATWRLGDKETSGERFLAANFAEWVGAGDLLAERLGAMYEKAEVAEARSIAQLLSGVPNSRRAAELYVELLRDPRDEVRWEALTSASGSLRPDVLATPLLDAIMAEGGDGMKDTAGRLYESFLKFPPPVLTGVLSRVGHYLNSADASHRKVAAGLLGSVLKLYGDGLEAGDIRSAHVRGELGHRALNDPAPEVAQVAARDFGTRGDGQAYWTFVKALDDAGDRDSLLRAVDVLGWFLSAYFAPPAPRGEWVVNEDGEMQLKIEAGPSRPSQPELYAPLVKLTAQPGDAEVRERAARILLGEASGHIALAGAIMAHTDAKEYERAIELSDFALTLKPDFLNAYWWRGRTFDEAGRLAEARDDYRRVIAAGPRDTAIFYRSAHVLYRLGENEAALSDLERAIELDPNDPRSHHLKSSVLLNLERPAEAAEAATRTIELDGRVAETYLLRASARAALKDFAGALADAEHARELDPADPRATEWRDYLLKKNEGGG